jgi:hypothetical protein
MLTLHMFRSFGFPNARREEVDRLRVAMVSRVRGPGFDTLSFPAPVGYAVDGWRYRTPWSDALNGMP